MKALLISNGQWEFGSQHCCDFAPSEGLLPASLWGEEVTTLLWTNISWEKMVAFRVLLGFVSSGKRVELQIAVFYEGN